MPPKKKGSVKGGARKKSQASADDPVKQELVKVKRQANELQVQINHERVKTVEAQVNCENALARQASFEQKFENSTEESKQVSAFMALQQEKTAQKFIEKNKELTALNAKLTEERDQLKEELESAKLTAKEALEAKESEFRQLRDAMIESRLHYEGMLTDFASKLSESLIKDWDAERKFDNEQEAEVCRQLIDLGVLPPNL
ncbi:unnamed protein product [Dibothriocephalus latus]|uniref:Dynein regulatory complex protein 12 n=1 Tax=Dibothriocephalus latus TaxID=60516 RepID=A0A3P7L0F1_DIBLA|nr:unnamed protein product [Dibothriocephalus latus]